ncbi:hypothetical protein PENTCL1PPCAC_14511, partial [Pristionchus entomophagus]
FRMNFRSVLFITIVGLLLVSSLEAAKAGKGKKGSREVKSVEKGAKVEKKVQKDKTVKAEKAAEDVGVVFEESPVAGEAPTPKIFRPKTLKMISAYDKCRMDCEKIIDQQGMLSYANQLRDELASVESVLEGAAEEAEGATA